MSGVPSIEPENQGTCAGRIVLESLKELRLQLGYSVDGIAEALDIRPAYVEALERGELTRCLGPGYVRSIVNRYAVCLGLDAEALIAQLGPPRRTMQALNSPSQPRPVGALSEGRRVFRDGGSPDSPVAGRFRRRFLLVALAAGILAAGFLGAVQLGLFQGDTGAASAETGDPAVVEVSEGGAGVSTTITTTVSAAGPAPAAETTSSAGALSTTTTTLGSSYAISLEATSEVWFEVEEEDSERTLFEGIKQEGEGLDLQADGPLLITVGRPEALSAEIDGSVVATPSGQLWRATSAGLEARD